MDNGNNGDYSVVLSDTLDTQVIIASGILKGKTYRVMYRAKNSIGPGAWSDIAYITAATVPTAPPIPIVSSVDNTQVTLTLRPSSDDGGLAVSAYVLYVDQGIQASSFDQVTSYDGSSSSLTLSVGDVFGSTTITAGQIYTFVYLAQNSLGNS